MDRRRFTTGALAAGLAAPPMLGPVSAFANPKEDDDRMEATAGRIRLQLAAQGLVLVTWILMVQTTRVWGLNIGTSVPQYPASRADASKVPILGQFTRPPLDVRFRNAVFLGELVLLGSMLVIAMTRTLQAAPKKTLVTHRDTEWEVAQTARPVQIENLPSVGDLFRRQSVGQAWLKDREVLVIVEPSIIAIEDR